MATAIMKFQLPSPFKKRSLAILLGLTLMTSRASAEDKALPPGNYLLVYREDHSGMLSFVVTIKAKPDSSLSISCEKAASPATIFQKGNIFSFSLLLTGPLADGATDKGWINNMTFSGNLAHSGDAAFHGVFAGVNTTFPQGSVEGWETGEFLLYPLPEGH